MSITANFQSFYLTVPWCIRLVHIQVLIFFGTWGSKQSLQIPNIDVGVHSTRMDVYLTYSVGDIAVLHGNARVPEHLKETFKEPSGMGMGNQLRLNAFLEG